jgi:MSHA biogenesis protein MshG
MKFEYKLRTPEGRVVTGYREAASRSELLKKLQATGSHPLVVRQISAPEPKSRKKKAGTWERFFYIGKPVSRQEMIIFTRSLYSLVHAGISFVAGIRDIAAQIKNPYFRAILMDISENVNAGSRLSESMIKYPKVFSEYYCYTIQAGEASGKLERVLARMVKALQRDLEFNRMVQNAIRYPMMVIGMLILGFIVVIFFVVPSIAKVFANFNTQLPLPTRIIIEVGNFCQAFWLPILLLFLSLIAVIYLMSRNPQGCFILDSIKLKLPVMGPIFQKIEMVQFTSSLESLYGSGILLTEAMEICSKVVKNSVLKKTLYQISVELRQGKKLAECIAGRELFPPLVARMITVGEHTGTLESMLGETAVYYDMEIEYEAKFATSVLEPILIVVLGIMVLVFALGVYMPMWSVMDLFRH